MTVSQEPPPPPPPPPTGSPNIGPPMGSPGLSSSATLVVDAEKKKAENSADRMAMMTLAASPEILAILFGFTVVLAILTQNVVGTIVGVFVFAVLGIIYMTNADWVAGSLLLATLGIMVIILVGDKLDPEFDSIWFVVPGLVLVACEMALAYNGYRRRRGEISGRITRMIVQNMLAIAALSIPLALLLIFLADEERQVSWPWFAATVLGLSGAASAALVVIRRSSAPADVRRFNPGRRMLPPPKD